MALVYFAVAAIDSVTERKHAELSDTARVNVRWLSAVVLLILAPAGGGMSGAMFLVLVTAVNVIQVVFDMAMAPFEEAEHLEASETLADLARAGEVKATGAPRRDVMEAVRKGTPSTMRRDLYFYFIEGGWARLGFAFVVVFGASNLFFAGLYFLEPGSIANADFDDFADAFFFSVQTMSTIGYGALSPATFYGNLVVTIEAAFGIVAVAVATGLVFAKISRAKASVLFSEPIVVTTMNGKKILMLRMGNARGNELVDAEAHLSVLRDELSPEGHHMRRVRDVKLQRGRQPMFVLSWSLIHEIDDTSPLKDVDWDDPAASVMSFILTMTGHDGTYGQTVFARKQYFPEAIFNRHRFADIISQLDDGRLMVDYSKFHHVISEDELEKAAQD